MYTVHVFITLDQIKPPGIISLMVRLSIRRHIAVFDGCDTDSIKISKLHGEDIVAGQSEFSDKDFAEQTVWKPLNAQIGGAAA